MHHAPRTTHRWVSLEEDEAAIAAQLPSVGPLSALLDATELQFYSEGVWNGYVDGSRPGMGCRDYLNHAVLIGIPVSPSP